MSTRGIAKASRVDRAVERLEAAVSRLDEAFAALPATNPDGEGAADDAALGALRDENAELRALNRTAAERLGAAIERLQGLLDRKAEA